MKRITTSLLLATIALTVPTPSFAQATDGAEAQKLFDDALTLMKAGRYAEACPKLQQSQKLDPGMGTKYRLAECYESAGWVGSAWALFTEVAEDAKKASRSDRESQARKHAASLLPRVPMVTLRVSDAAQSTPGLEVKRDGEPFARGDWNRSMPLDPGAHAFTASAPGKKPWQENVRVLEGGSLVVTLPPLEAGASSSPPAAAAAAPPAASPPADGASPGLGTQRIAAITVGAVGVAALGLGAVTGALASSKWSSAQAGCQGGDADKCTASAIAAGHDANTMATVSTLGFIVGGAALAGGVALWFTAPTSKAPATGLRLSPGLGGASIAVEGAF